MEKLKMHSLNKVDENVEKIAALFPNCATEAKAEDGSIVRRIDFDMLRQELSGAIVEGREERYQFTWPDKKKSVLLANAPISKTLRPCREESVDFDTTENLYIEGDNLEVLKLLQETYLGKIKMIYIDPPYNTGNDFVYNDDFRVESGVWRVESGDYDEEGNRLVKNLDTNGRFHTDWLNMIYPRLKLAKDLLSDDGVIFVSIGQNELDNLVKMCNDAFGSANKIGVVTRVMKSGGGKGQFFSPNVEYIVIYAKQIQNLDSFKEPISEEIIKKLYTSIEENGPRKGQKYRPFGLYQSSLDPLRGCTNQRYYIEAPDGTLLIPPGKVMPAIKADGEMVSPKTSDDKVWRWSKERYLAEKAKGNITFKKSNGVLIDSEGKPAVWNVYTKIWLDDRQEEGMVPVDLISKWENRMSAKELAELNIPFDFAKPVELIKYLIYITQSNKDITILDFFSGSATTAHAVMQLNAEDGGNRKFIMVQLPEETAEKSEAYKAGYKNICEIGKERIRRAGQKILKESGVLSVESGVEAQLSLENSKLHSTNSKLDVGFRVLKCDTTNMKDVYYRPDEAEQNLFDNFTDNIKEDRTAEDLLFQVMLDLGILLSSKIQCEELRVECEDEFHSTHSKFHTVYNVADNFLIACFDENITDELITKIAKQEPYYFVMRDSGFANDSVATNAEQIFKAISPTTGIKIL